MKIKTIPPKYPNDLIHIDRWMCSRCGLIFDFSPEHGPNELGWMAYDPPLEHVDIWTDKKGYFHLDEPEHREICPRCGLILDDVTLIKIVVSPFTSLKDIQTYIEQGEGTQIEFKVIFPDDAHQLTKDIAAFATTQGGKIFLGIDNNGQINSLPGIDTPTGKDKLQKRILGLTSKIEPKVKLFIDFVLEKDIRIVVITVPKGNMPFYSINNITYIRELNQSRPATSAEIIDLVNAWKDKTRTG